MANRATQVAAFLESSGTPHARATQVAAVLESSASPHIRVTQVAAILTSKNLPPTVGTGNARQDEQKTAGVSLVTPPPIPPTPPPPPLQKILPAYPYLQYQDDPNIVAFFTAYNELAQSYLDWFNQTPLALYTSPNVSGQLLDWIGNGIYGIPRPVFSTLATRFHGAALDAVPLNTIAINGSRTTSSGGAVLATDDFYKRVITWLTYVGDGRMFNTTVLRKRIARFLYGVNGTDITLSQAQAVHLNFASPTEYQITIPASANPASAYFAEAFNSGILSFPFQLSAEIVIA